VDFNDQERLRWERRQISRAKDGDTGAFAELYRAYADSVYRRVLVPKLGDRSAADDALSETFRTAWQRLETYDAQGVSIYFWLSRIAANKATDMHRARAVTGRALAGFEVMVAPFLDPAVDPHGALTERDEQLALKRAIERCLERINPRYADAIRLRFIQELSREACADALDVKLGTFDVLLLRALRSFKKQFQADREDPR
jgi:RNA polymerase sigma-70 factor (ECF subfamily)